MAHVDTLNHQSDNSDDDDLAQLAVQANQMIAHLSAEQRDRLRGMLAYWQPAATQQQVEGMPHTDDALSLKGHVGTITDAWDFPEVDSDVIGTGWVRIVYPDGQDLLVPSGEVALVAPSTDDTGNANRHEPQEVPTITATMGRMTGGLLGLPTDEQTS